MLRACCRLCPSAANNTRATRRHPSLLVLHYSSLAHAAAGVHTALSVPDCCAASQLRLRAQRTQMRALAHAAAPQLRAAHARAAPLRRHAACAAAARGAAGGPPASERDGVLRGVLPEHRDIVARVVELAQAAGERWDVATTDFLEPPVASDALLAVSRLADVEARAWGGFATAERCRLRLGRPEALDAEASPEEPACVALLNVEGNFMFDTASHRDFLGVRLLRKRVQQRVVCTC